MGAKIQISDLKGAKRKIFTVSGKQLSLYDEIYESEEGMERMLRPKLPL